jgi:hypothetical protein
MCKYACKISEKELSTLRNRRIFWHILEILLKFHFEALVSTYTTQ